MKLIKIALLLLVVCMLVFPAAANWNYDGYPLTTSSNGTINGGVYVSDGDNHNTGFGDYITNFSVPDGTTHSARLYIDVWGMNEYNTGWINLTFNGHTYPPVFINGINDNNPNAWGSGHGVWWISYDVTNNVTPGASNQAIVQRTLGDRITRVILVDAYNDIDGCGHSTYYWINDGNTNLHYNHSTGYNWDLDNTVAWFNGAIENMNTAELFTIYHAGGNCFADAEPDYLYFNAFETYHRPNQLGDDGNETWGDDDISETGFDMLSFDVTNLMKTTGNNATFWRGHDDDGDGWIYHDPSGSVSTGAEGEAYLHPMLAVLTVNSTQHYLTRSMVGGAANLFSLPLMDSEPISTALSSIDSDYRFVNRYNSTTQAWERYDKNYPFQPLSDFTTLDPGIGYQVVPYNDCTMTWTSN